MTETKVPYLEYVGPAAIFVGGTALAAATGGGTLALGAGALIGTLLTNLGPNLIASIMDRKAEARASAREFALNDTLARAFGRAAGDLAAKVGREAESAGDTNAAKALRSLAKGFEDLWVSQMHRRYYEDLEKMDGQDLARVFSVGLTGQTGMLVSESTWRSLIASHGMPLADHFRNWQIKAEWIDRLVTRLVSVELTEAYAHELSYKPEAAAKMSMRLLADLRAAGSDPGVTSGLDAAAAATLKSVLKGIEPQFSDLSTQLEGLEKTVREEGAATREAIHDSTDELKRHIDESIATSSRPFELPPAALGGFVGRGKELGMLVARLREGQNTSVVAFAGMGKTALAAEALREVVPDREAMAVSKFPDGIVFLDLYTHRGDAERAWATLANCLKGVAFEQGAAAEERAREACRNASFLLIVEGAEEADGADGRVTLEKLLSVLTPQNRWLVLTRNVNQTVPAERIEIREELSEGDATTLFENRLGSTEIETALRDRVLALLEGHPLAITWAAGLLGQDLEDPAELAADWEAVGLPSIRDPKQGVGQRTLRWLFERSERRLTPEQRRVLRACGLLARAPFPREAIEAIDPDARPHLAALAARSLVIRSHFNGFWEFSHALSYRFARSMEIECELTVNNLAKWCESNLRRFKLSSFEQSTATMNFGFSHARALLESNSSKYLLPNLAKTLEGFECLVGSKDLTSDEVGKAFASARIWLRSFDGGDGQNSEQSKSQSISISR